MFNFMLKHKRGFTLVELMIVVALLGFGVVALANLFQSAFRTFNKTEERYIKQEAVKAVAESLQSYTNITIATKAELYADSSVVPTVAGEDLSYTYIYIEPTDVDDDGKSDGYYLYRLNRGMAKKDGAVCLNPEVPLYVQFNAYRDRDVQISIQDGDDIEHINSIYPVRNQCGVKVRICAVDNDFEYKDSYTDKDGKAITENEAIADYIFYDTTVSYHFPNMVANREKIRVNVMFTDKDGKVTEGEESDGVVRDRANVYTYDPETGMGSKTTTTVASIDEDAKVLRVTYDTNVTGEDVTVPISVSSFCFIATAGYGEATGEVGILCDFRDQCLKTNPLGRMFVKAYYTISPHIAEFISDSEPLKAVTRVALKPLVAFAVYALEPELLIEQIPFIIMGASSFVGIIVVGVHSYRKRKIEE